jgi:hypothetical protein
MSELAPLPGPGIRRGQRLESIRRTEQQIAVLQLQQRLQIAALYREDQAGRYARYVRDELVMVWRRSPRQCQNRIDAALVFADFPAVHALIAAGTWLIDHADAALDTLVGSGLTHEEQQQVLELVLSRRVHLTPWEVRQAVRTAIVVLFPEHAAGQAEKAERDRDVKAYDDAPGAATLVAHGPAHLVAAMMAALDALARPSGSDDQRTLAQRRFDTLLALVCGQITPSNWQVHVLTELATLNGENELPADLPGFAGLPAPVAREIATQGELRRVVIDDDGLLIGVEGRVHRPDLPLDQDAPDSLAHETDVVVEEVCESAFDGMPAIDSPDEPAVDEPTVQETPSKTPLGGPVAEDVTCEAPLGESEAHREDESADSAEPDEDDLRWYAQHRPLADDETRTPGGARPVHLRQRWSPEAWRSALHRIATDPFTPMVLSSDCYVPPPSLQRHLERRDKTCVFPGCPRRADHCDKDHLIPFPRGSTCECNLASECGPHHHAKHEYFSVERLPDGSFRWTSPAGITADRPPRPVLDASIYKAR